MTGYDSLDDAAAAALYEVQQQKDSDKYEFLGLIYQDPDTGKYLFTEPQSRQQRAESSGTFSIPQGSLRGIYHNHPATEGTNKARRSTFSDADLDVIKQLNVPGFIGVGQDIFRRDPGQKDKMRPVRSIGVGIDPSRPQRTKGVGTEVLARIPIEEIIKHSAIRKEAHEELFSAFAKAMEARKQQPSISQMFTGNN